MSIKVMEQKTLNGKSSKRLNKLAIPELLREKSKWVRNETLKIHKIDSKTRLASSLSSVEIFVALYYGNVLKFDPNNTRWEMRDRVLISKGHGSISLYPVLADLGFFDKRELSRVSKEGALLKAIPDSLIPGYETINGSLGQGLGVACGMALSLKLKQSPQTVFVVMGDGELNEGSVWEAIMFAGHHKLDNIVLIIDDNKICMMDYCKNILDLRPLKDKFEVFKWKTASVDGHDVVKLHDTLMRLKNDKNAKPKVLIADTVKGKGVPRLEKDSLCHIKTVSAKEVDNLIGESE